jgi:hypothetical protein
LIADNHIHNEIVDYGNNAVNGSQAPLQVQMGSERNTLRGNKVFTKGASNAGPEFFVNIGPHCHFTAVLDNDFYGPVAKAGINVESTYESSGAISTSYASGLGYSSANWATAALNGVVLEGNKVNLTSAKVAVQIIQAAAINITNLIERANEALGTTFTSRFSLTIVSGSATGQMNQGNVTPIELADVTNPNVTGGSLFKRTTAGNRDIIAFTGGFIGQVIRVQCTGAGVFGQTGTLRLKGGVNVTPTAATDILMEFTLVGTEWIETWRNF